MDTKKITLPLAACNLQANYLVKYSACIATTVSGPEGSQTLKRLEIFNKHRATN